MTTGTKSVLVGGSSQHRGPEMGICLSSWRKRKADQCMESKKRDNKDQEMGTEAKSCRYPKDFALHPKLLNILEGFE